MEEGSSVFNTFVVERSYSKPPEKVFAAFSDPVKKRRWFGEGPGHDVLTFEMDFRVDGAERMTYRFKEGTPFKGVVLDYRNSYQDIAPNRRIVIAQAMDFGGRRVSASLVTIELLRTDDGTDLICTHQGVFFEGADGPEIRQHGWKALFERLARELDS